MQTPVNSELNSIVNESLKSDLYESKMRDTKRKEEYVLSRPLQAFYDLPIAKKTQIISALMFVAFGGMVAVESRALVSNLRSQLHNQNLSQLTVTELNYNTELKNIGLTFASLAENPTIIKATLNDVKGQVSNGTEKQEVQIILDNEVEIRNLEYATLVGKDLRIIATGKTDEDKQSQQNIPGQIFNPSNLVSQALQTKQQIQTTELRIDTVKKQKPKNTLISYTITPIKAPGTQIVIGVLVSGNIINKNMAIFQKTVEAFPGIGYAGIYAHNPINKQFSVATSYAKTELRQAFTNLPLTNQSILQEAVTAKGNRITNRISVGDHTYTVAAKAIPNLKGEPIAILLYGDPEFALNEILKEGLELQVTLSVVVLSLLVLIASTIANSITKPIKNLFDVTKEFTQGNYHVRAKVNSKDEIGQLAGNFNAMAQTIEANINQIEAKIEMFRFLSELPVLNNFDNSSIDQWLNQVLAKTRQLINSDRLFLYRVQTDSNGQISQESIKTKSISRLEGSNFNHNWIPEEILSNNDHKNVWIINNISENSLSSEYKKWLERGKVRASLGIPIFYKGTLFGVLFAHQCLNQYEWNETKINFLKQIVNSLEIILERVYLLQKNTLETKLFASLKAISVNMAREFKADNLFNLVVKESREALLTDRVIIYRFDQNWKGTIIAESVDELYPNALGKMIADPCFAEKYVEKYRQGRVQATNNIYNAGLTNCHLQQLAPLKVKANLVVPIVVLGELLGLLIAHHCECPREWQQPEINFLTQVGLQVGITLEKANLFDEYFQSEEQQKLAKEQLQKRALDLLIEVEPISRGDLTIRAKVTQDEIGTIADSYNSTVENLNRIVTNVKQASDELTITTKTNENSITTLTTEAMRQVQEIGLASDHLTVMQDSINSVANNAETTLTAFSEASKTLEAGDLAINQTVDSMMAIGQTVAETAQKVQNLGESSQKIAKVVNLISRFAAQTHLLALKASIEAARAGEEGRGFAVIADEVRSLAASSAEATAEIETLVNSIQLQTKEVSQTMKTGTEQVVIGTKLVEQTRHNLNKITVTSSQIEQLVNSIVQATIEQSATSESMYQVMGDVTSIAQNTSDTASQLSDSMQKILSLAQQLQGSVDKFKVHKS
ncbi:methyl-accepting chemotaxis protein [Aphanothece sacrum]|uniref:Methyl-accepting chemotaxis protein n=1 Tax=Aphanothece sacrum FPU1 TaxID=1920663 RepID=A0A401IL67_APHSA|nr:methyl-accepting chemotaxis protein [Aphanothece sacrum]GBF81978.1 methyl-accepting chemotaxis protein [Aphanothece sacrum FPU1]GBF83608.1 methyl-accepting chemotaxis protein [Aphanothece sacrum FPU3]